MSYTPDTRQRLQLAQRFFARLEGFSLECPHCGKVYVVRTRTHTRNWDPFTARFQCTEAVCMRSYVLGIVAWPIIAVSRVASATPADQVPNHRQVAQLRKEGGGWWMADKEGIKQVRPDETNLTTETDRPEEE